MERLFDSMSSLSYTSVEMALNGILISLLLTALIWTIWRLARKNNDATTGYAVWCLALVVVVALPFAMGLTSSQGLDLSRSTILQSNRISGVVGKTESFQMEKPLAAEGRIGTTKASTGDLGLKVPSLPPSKSVITDQKNPERNVALVSLLARLLPVSVIGLWFVIAAALLVRLLRGYKAICEIKKRCRYLDDARFPQLQAELTKGINDQPVKIGLTGEIDYPMAAGLGEPTILIPDKVYDSMSQAELESIVIHELAHLRRYDDWTKLGQKLMEAVAFFNPAVYWVGRQLELHREMACDDEVVASTGRPGDYARCLTKLVQLSSTRKVALVPGALVGRKQIFRRFDRLLSGNVQRPSVFSRLRLAGVLTSVVLLLIVALQIGPVIAMPGTAVTFAELNDTYNSVLSDDPTESDDSNPENLLSEAKTNSPAEEPSHWTSIDRLYQPSPVGMESALIASNSVAIGSNSKSASAGTSRSNKKAKRSSSSGISSSSREKISGSYNQVIDGVIDSDGRLIKGTMIEHAESGRNNVTWSNGYHEIKIRSEGEIVFTDDERGIKSISPGGHFYIREKSGFKKHELEVESNSDGSLDYSYAVNGRERDFEDEGREWLSDVLIEAIRHTGIGAEARVARILKEDGFGGFMDELRDIESDWVKRIYCTIAIESRHISAEDYSDLMNTVARDWDSDYEKAELLIGIVDEANRNPDLMADYVDVVNSMESDYETRRVLSELSIDEDANPRIIRLVLEIASGMDSDYEKAELLIDMSRFSHSQSDLQREYVDAIIDMDSDYEKRRVLSATTLDERTDPEVIMLVLEIASEMDSDYERAELLTDLAPYISGNKKLRDAYLTALEATDSDYETRRILSALSNKRDLDKDALSDLLEMSERMDSDYEKAEFLLELAELCENDAELRLKLVETASTLDSDYETKRVLTSMNQDCDSGEEYFLAVLKAIRTMDSDYESAELMLDLAHCINKYDAARDAYLMALRQMGSDYEKKRVLTKLIPDSPTDTATILAILDLVEEMASDFEKSEILKKLVKHCRDDEVLEEAFVDVIESLSSDYERNALYGKLYGRKYRTRGNGRD